MYSVQVILCAIFFALSSFVSSCGGGPSKTQNTGQSGTPTPPPPPATTTNITLNGTSYALRPHPIVYFDGAGGVIDKGIKDPDGTGPMVAPKANGANVPWIGLKARAAYFNSNFPYNNPNYIDRYWTGQVASMWATYWYSDNSQTTYLNNVLDMLNHFENYAIWPCDESQTYDCNAGGGTGYAIGTYGVVYWLQEWIAAFELVRSQMTTVQQQTFASKVLNDLSAFGGIDGSPGASCTNPSVTTSATVTAGVNGNLTASAALFGGGNSIQTGYWLMMTSGNGYNVAKVVSVTDSTHATISSEEASNWNTYSGTINYRRNTWQTGDCGLLWTMKHGRFTPQVISFVSGSTAYPQNGGAEMAYGSNNTFSSYQGYLAAFLSLVDVDNNASTRSQSQLTNLYNDWFTNVYGDFVMHTWTGFHQTGAWYGQERPYKVANVNAMMLNSLTTWKSLGGNWDKDLLYHTILNLVPGCITEETQWGQDFSATGSQTLSVDMLGNMMPTYFEYRGTNEGKWFNWALQNVVSTCYQMGNSPGTTLYWTSSNINGVSVYARTQWLYWMTDPSFGKLSLSSSGPLASDSSTFLEVLAAKKSKPGSRSKLEFCRGRVLERVRSE